MVAAICQRLKAAHRKLVFGRPRVLSAARVNNGQSRLLANHFLRLFALILSISFLPSSSVKTRLTSPFFLVQYKMLFE